MSTIKTPISKVIEWYDNQLKPLLEDEKRQKEANRLYNDRGDNEDIDLIFTPIQMEAMVALQRAKIFLESLLPEEKQFAEDAYKEGFDSKECTIIAGIGESFPSYTQDESFNDYYKKYEDENKDKA